MSGRAVGCPSASTATARPVTYAPEEVRLNCPECGGSADDPQQMPEEGEEVGDLCTHPIHDPQPSP
jgi:hypothetical protein